MRNKLQAISISWPRIFLWTALIATIGGALFATKTLSGIEKNIAAAKEAQRPANIKLIKITAPNCSDCFNVETEVSALKKQNVSVGEEKSITFDSLEAQSLIRNLGIKKVPTYIATGEVGKKSIEGFIKSNGEIKNNTFVFTKVAPVFIDPQTQKEVGRVVATILTDSSCSQCLDPKLTVESYKNAGVKIIEEKTVNWTSSEGQSLIGKYNIKKLPTFLFSSDFDFYDQIKAEWSQIGTVEQDKTYVARNLFLPYRDLEEGRVLGLVDAIYLTDSSCSDCYKPETVQKNILVQGYGIAFRSQRSVDANSDEGRNLLDQYKITKAPTVLLSPEVDKYASLKNVWPNVGTVETNGWYVFREMQQLGNIIYKDLTTSQVVGRVEANQ